MAYLTIRRILIMQLNSRLATYSTLIGVDKYKIKQFMKDNLQLDRIIGRYAKDNSYIGHIRDNKKLAKEIGHEIAKTLSEIKKYQDQRDDRSLLVRSIYYFEQLRQNFNDSQLQSIEPNILFIRDQYQNNNWIKIPFAQYDIDSTNLRKAQVLHNVHQSEVDPMMIAYYPTLHHLRIKKEIRTKLGKYLSNFREYFNLSEADIKSCVEAHASFIQSRKGWNVKFIESNDPQGWIDVYKKSQYKPRSTQHMSCMTDCESVQVYANDQSVLRLAYMIDNETILARCIVREDDKGYIRVYPDPNGYPEGRFLLDTLKSLGYEDQTNLNGVFLNAIQKNNGYLSPYIDLGNDMDSTTQLGSIKTIDSKDYILIGYGDQFQLDSTDGYVNDAELFTCDDCNNRTEENYITYSEYHDRHICDSCSDDYVYAYKSGGDQDYIHVDQVTCVNDTYYVTEDLCDFDIYLCEESDNYYPIDELYSTSRGLIHESYCVQLDHEDIDGNDYAHQDDVATLSDGSTCHEDDFTTLQEELEEEEKEGMIIESSFPNPSRPNDIDGSKLFNKDQTNE
jgi:hypothetical protein